MKKMFTAGIIVVLIYLGVSAVRADVNVSKLSEIPNIVLLEEGVVGGGSLSEKAIAQAKAEGIRSIVDIRSPQEGAGEERVLVQKYGMNYFNIPVTPYTLRKAQADVISHILSDGNNKPVIIHSNAGNRVGALWGLYVRFYRGATVDEAFKEAVAKGLRSDDLKDVVLKLLK